MACIRVCICICIRVFICIFICICIQLEADCGPMHMKCANAAPVLSYFRWDRIARALVRIACIQMMTEETEANIKGRIEKYAKSSWSGQHMWKYAHHYFAAAYAPVVLLYYLPELVMPVARSAYIYVCASTLWQQIYSGNGQRPPPSLYHAHLAIYITISAIAWLQPFHSLPQKKTRNTSRYFLCSICVLSVHPYVWPPSAAITVPQDSWAWPFPIPFTNVPSLILPSLLCTSSQWTCQPSSILLNPLRKRFWN